MSLSETIKHIETELQKPIESAPTIIAEPLNNKDGEELMLYIQRLRQQSWNIADNFL